MRFIVNPKAAVIAATLVLPIVLVFNIVTGLNSGPLNPTPAFAAGSCAVSSDSSDSNSSSTSYSNDATGASLARTDAVAAYAAAAAHLTLVASRYFTDRAMYTTLQNEYNEYVANCGANQDMEDLLAAIQTNLSTVSDEGNVAQSYTNDALSDITAGDIAVKYVQNEDYSDAIGQYKSAIRDSAKVSQYTAGGECELSAVDAELSELGQMLTDECINSSESSSDSSSHSLSSFGMSSSYGGMSSSSH